jgi:copper homeostasis protein (lipoprotein)
MLSFILFTAVFSSFNPVFAETAEETHHAQNSLDWPGIYYGFLPCEDCKGIKATLALNKNNTYILITQYVGKSEREFVEKGKFTWSNKSDTIVLTPRKSATTQEYFVGENMLIQLDKEGNRISGKLADRYVLRRKDVTSEPPAHSSH